MAFLTDCTLARTYSLAWTDLQQLDEVEVYTSTVHQGWDPVARQKQERSGWDRHRSAFGDVIYRVQV